MSELQINSKTTKTQLIEMLQAQQKKLDAFESGRFDPKAEKRTNAVNQAKSNVAKCNNIDEVFDNISNILASVKGNLEEKLSVDKDLDTVISAKKAELQELYGFEQECFNIAALLNSKSGILEKYDQQIKDVKAALADEEARYKEAVDAAKTAVITEANDLKSQITIARKREEEEYTYNLNRKRQIAEDEWADEMKRRNQEMSAKEQEVSDRELAVMDKEEELKAAEVRIEILQTEINDSFEKGLAEGRAKAAKAFAIETNQLKAKHEYELNLLNNKYENSLMRIESLNDQINSITSQLKEAHDKNSELSAKVVEAMSVKAPIYQQSVNTQDKAVR